MNGYNKQETINTVVLLLTIFLALNLNKWLPDFENWTFFIILSLISAKGFYELTIRIIFFLISHNDFLMRVYWGKQFLAGYWTYEYTRENKKYIGIWQITQDLTSTIVIGSGLNDDFSTRTIVSSVSPLLSKQGVYFFINERSELNEDTGFISNVYSKTTLILDSPSSIFSEITTLRATTEIYGGKSNAHIHPNVVFHKHKEIKSQQELIDKLKKGEIN
ncbi:hypothetical protein MASR1M29_21610 [Cloacibacterium normanense]